MMKLILLIVVTLIQASVSTVALAQQDEPAAIVRSARLSMESVAPVTMVPGTVVSRNDANLAAEVTGRLIEVAEVGTHVAIGDMVARIEDTQLKLRLDEQQAEVERVRARLRFLEKEENRFMQLAESNLAAATQLEETRSDRDVSRGDLQVALSRLAQIEDQLARTRIAAPFAGIVVERLMMRGERVEAGSDVIRLLDQQHLEVIARAPLEYYSYVTTGQKFELRVRDVRASATVRTVVAVGSENTHQFEIRLDIESNQFPVGQTLRVLVPTSHAREALMAPRDALVLRPDGISVFLVDDEQVARQVLVKTGIGADDRIEVIGDLADGDLVVIRGNERLRTGQSVSVQPDSP